MESSMEQYGKVYVGFYSIARNSYPVMKDLYYLLCIYTHVHIMYQNKYVPPYNFGAADLVRNTYVLLFSYYFVITRTRYYYSSHFALLL